MMAQKRPLQVGYCIGCIGCKVKQWVPYHPLFICTNGGETDERTTKTIRCPNETSGDHPVT